MNILEVEKIEFGYNENLVLKGIDFSIERGKFISIIGPNGSGKSTLLKTLNNLFKPTCGSIKIDGINISSFKKRDLAKEIALVPQDTNIDYDFSVEDIVLMGRHPYKKRFERENDEDYRIARDSMELTNTIKFSKKSVREISGGERQRVIIAKALAQNPRIILLDEPTSNLDINHQIDILNLLKKLNKERSTTVVLVIHDINLAARYSDEIILVNHGKILSKGRPEEVINLKNIEETYNMKVAIESNKYTSSLSITPIETNRRVKNKKIENVHIISGGGSGQDIINFLYRENVNMSMGVLNVGDTDWAHGKSLGVNVIEEAPFTGIQEKNYEKNILQILKSQMVIIGNLPIGNGNLKNLEAGKIALENNIPVYFLKEDDKDFDYTGGKAIKLVEEMKELGLKFIESLDELLDIL